jgi:hypothetical protein
MQAIDTAAVAWEGAISVEALPDGSRSAWRLKHTEQGVFAPLPGQAGLLEVAMASSGVRLVFSSNCTRIKLVASARNVHMDCCYDLRCGGELLATSIEHAPEPIPGGKPWQSLEAFLAGDPSAQLLAYMTAVESAKARPAPAPHTVIFDGLSGAEHVYELWLPHSASVWIHSLEVSAPSTVSRFHDRRPRWITHGSSITHCSEAYSPSRTWPATAARLAGDPCAKITPLPV